MTYEGKIREIYKEEGIGRTNGNHWNKETYVVCVDEQHNETLHFSLLNENINKYQLTIGDTVSFQMEFRTRVIQKTVDGKEKKSFLYNGYTWGDIVVKQRAQRANATQQATPQPVIHDPFDYLP